MGAKAKETMYDEIVDQLRGLLEEEHGGCDNNTCDITAFLERGYTYWPIHLFIGSGASSEKFDKLYNKLPQAKFRKDAHRELDEFHKEVESVECSCGAVVYDPESSSFHCDSCGEDAYFRYNIGEAAVNAINDSFPDSIMVDGFKFVEIEKGSATNVLVAREYGKNPDQLTADILSRSTGIDLPAKTRIKLIK